MSFWLGATSLLKNSYIPHQPNILKPQNKPLLKITFRFFSVWVGNFIDIWKKRLTHGRITASVTAFVASTGRGETCRSRGKADECFCDLPVWDRSAYRHQQKTMLAVNGVHDGGSEENDRRVTCSFARRMLTGRSSGCQKIGKSSRAVYFLLLVLVISVEAAVSSQPTKVPCVPCNTTVEVNPSDLPVVGFVCSEGFPEAPKPHQHPTTCLIFFPQPHNLTFHLHNFFPGSLSVSMTSWGKFRAS